MKFVGKLILFSIIILGIVGFYLWNYPTGPKIMKSYSPDRQYSFYGKIFFLDQFIPMSPGSGSDARVIVYLYDEINKKILCKTRTIEQAMKEVRWTDSTTVLLPGADGLEICKLPRPIKE